MIYIYGGSRLVLASRWLWASPELVLIQIYPIDGRAGNKILAKKTIWKEGEDPLTCTYQFPPTLANDPIFIGSFEVIYKILRSLYFFTRLSIICGFSFAARNQVSQWLWNWKTHVINDETSLSGWLSSRSFFCLAQSLWQQQGYLRICLHSSFTIDL